MRFLDYFSKAEKDECDPQDWSVSDKFGVITPCSTTYHLEVGAPVSLKVATKASFGGKKIVKIEIFSLPFKGRNGGVRPRRVECPC